jgi:LytR cell envelope-related transcriptional attenuator
VASSLTRRPLPALISLVALLLLTALVWWRVLHRDDGAGAAHGSTRTCVTPTAEATLPAPARIRIQVLNSTTRAGIAARARTTLVSYGFDSPTAAGNDRQKRKVTGVAEIRFGSNAAEGAKLVAYYLPGARLVRTTSRSATVVVALGPKYRRIASQATVQAALKAHKVALASPTPSAAGSAGSSNATHSGPSTGPSAASSGSVSC